MSVLEAGGKISATLRRTAVGLPKHWRPHRTCADASGRQGPHSSVWMIWHCWIPERVWLNLAGAAHQQAGFLCLCAFAAIADEACCRTPSGAHLQWPQQFARPDLCPRWSDNVANVVAFQEHQRMACTDSCGGTFTSLMSLQAAGCGKSRAAYRRPYGTPISRTCHKPALS